MKALFWIQVAILFYTFIGYPLLLIILSVFKKPTKIADGKNFFPLVSIIVPAFNEENVIRQRIENLLSLDYPKDRLEIIVVSDASTDQTEAIVKEFETDGVVLKRAAKRRGKIANLNECVPLTKGNIVVFTDADVMFDKGNLKALVVPFSNERVGCVIGVKRIIKDESQTGYCESLYWKYEIALKSLEARFGAIGAGASGCNFAIRKELYHSLDDKTTAEDLILPVFSMQNGYELHFSKDAISYEKLLKNFRDEFKRKIRIVTGGLHAVSLIKNQFEFINLPFFYVFSLFSHKILRWFASYFILGVFLTSSFLMEGVYYYCFWGQLLFYSLAVFGFLMKKRGVGQNDKNILVCEISLYFLAMNFASLIGTFQFFLRKHQGWITYKKPDCCYAEVK